MTLNSVIALFCSISPNLIALQACYVTVVEDRPMYRYAEYCLPLLAKTHPPCSAVSLW